MGSNPDIDTPARVSPIAAGNPVFCARRAWNWPPDRTAQEQISLTRSSVHPSHSPAGGTFQFPDLTGEGCRPRADRRRSVSAHRRSPTNAPRHAGWQAARCRRVKQRGWLFGPAKADCRIDSAALSPRRDDLLVATPVSPQRLQGPQKCNEVQLVVCSKTQSIFVARHGAMLDLIPLKALGHVIVA